MKKRTKILISILATVLIILILMPPLSPVLFNTSSEKGAIRHEIYKMGYPYQSYFTILQKRESDKSSGSLYSLMLFNAWKSETGQTPYLCYSKKVTEDEYKVDCGTAP
ncbi:MULTISPECIES: hypothetical protein [Bacillus]|uniref:hypothetical protein n=1 Tax=Bacillus TaxID=1386 RepID=UPI000BA8924D|nr:MULTISPECIES: hypothetical protein [Bacillus]MCM2583062.1 hypothetical protein [Bacillus stercoris]PAO66720.1 hypothetical protein CIK44_21185 [Bacillus sp. X2(2017)]POO79509.1 hypothetical protein C1T30_29050 [Bacillus sp. MBGLi97]WGE40562.1 hypothetical protein QA442_08740 [Bacillus stercoris]